MFQMSIERQINIISYQQKEEDKSVFFIQREEEQKSNGMIQCLSVVSYQHKNVTPELSGGFSAFLGNTGKYMKILLAKSISKYGNRNTPTHTKGNKSLPHHMVIGTRALLALKWLVWR